MRTTLHNSQRQVVSIESEVEALKTYLELENLRFENKFDFSINIDDKIDVENYKIPTLLIQPFVENSIIHGINHKQDKGNISIEFNKNNGTIQCNIEDDGIGRKKSTKINKQIQKNHKSAGTEITENRLKIINSLYKTGFRVDYIDLEDENNQPNGTRVEIIIPVIEQL